MTQLTKQVVNSLESLKSAFLQNELAYLALTQKVEHAFRDKLAFELHNRLKGDKEIVHPGVTGSRGGNNALHKFHNSRI